MSEREDIAAHIVSTLSAVSSPITFGKVERNPFDAEELSQQQFPAVFVQTADETREDITIKNTGITRQGTIDFRIFGLQNPFIRKLREFFYNVISVLMSNNRSIQFLGLHLPTS